MHSMPLRKVKIAGLFYCAQESFWSAMKEVGPRLKFQLSGIEGGDAEGFDMHGGMKSIFNEHLRYNIWKSSVAVDVDGEFNNEQYGIRRGMQRLRRVEKKECAKKRRNASCPGIAEAQRGRKSRTKGFSRSEKCKSQGGGRLAASS